MSAAAIPQASHQRLDPRSLDLVRLERSIGRDEGQSLLGGVPDGLAPGCPKPPVSGAPPDEDVGVEEQPQRDRPPVPSRISGASGASKSRATRTLPRRNPPASPRTLGQRHQANERAAGLGMTISSPSAARS